MMKNKRKYLRRSKVLRRFRSLKSISWMLENFPSCGSKKAAQCMGPPQSINLCVILHIRALQESLLTYPYPKTAIPGHKNACQSNPNVQGTSLTHQLRKNIKMKISKWLKSGSSTFLGRILIWLSTIKSTKKLPICQISAISALLKRQKPNKQLEKVLRIS